MQEDRAAVCNLCKNKTLVYKMHNASAVKDQLLKQ